MTVTGVVDALEQARRRLEPQGRVLVLVPVAYRPWVRAGSRTLGRVDDRPFRPKLDIVSSGLQRVIDAQLLRPVEARPLDVVDRYDDAPAVFADSPNGWHFGARLRQAMERARAPLSVHMRAVLRVLAAGA